MQTKKSYYNHLISYNPQSMRFNEDFSMVVWNKSIQYIGKDLPDPFCNLDFTCDPQFIIPGLIDVGWIISNKDLIHNPLRLLRLTTRQLKQGITTMNVIISDPAKISEFQNSKVIHNQKNDFPRFLPTLSISSIPEADIFARNPPYTATNALYLKMQSELENYAEDICKGAHARNIKILLQIEKEDDFQKIQRYEIDTLIAPIDILENVATWLISHKMNYIPDLTPLFHSPILKKLVRKRRFDADFFQQLSTRIQQGLILGVGSLSLNQKGNSPQFWRIMTILNTYFHIPLNYLLKATTVHNARILGQEFVMGTLTPGKMADFLLYPENPIEIVKKLTHPFSIYIAGQNRFKIRTRVRRKSLGNSMKEKIN